MRIGEMSDMHLEFGPYDGPWGSGDLLLLSGDITVASRLYMAGNKELLAKYHEHADAVRRIADNTDKFLTEACARYETVAWCAGNHEHYGINVANTLKVIEQRYCDKFQNLAILEKEAIVVGDVLVFGATCWTNYDNNPLYMRAAQQRMNDFKQIWITDDGAERLIRPGDIYEDHLEAIRALEAHVEYAKANNKRMVVMTHHGPSKQSVHPKYRADVSINAAYSSNLEHLFGDHIPLWVHGHTHDSHDYTINGTRVVCNPRGYMSHDLKGLNKGFKGNLEINL